MLIQDLKINQVKNSSIITLRAFLIVGLIIATFLASTPADAEQALATFTIGGSDLSLSRGAGLKIPLSESITLDLNLASVAIGPSSSGERQMGSPPLPISKPPGSELHYTRLGVGFSFRF